MTTMRAAALGAALLGACAAPCAAQSDPVADFYRGKTVNTYIGVGVGGEYDLQARLVAKYLGRHIPGNPNVVPQNMTGASGLKMLNFLYNQAPRDGTAIGMIQNGFPAAQAIGRPGIQFDSNQLRWLGTIAPVVETMAVWHTADVRSIDDARKKEIVAGATARGGITFTYPALMNELLGTKFKIVTGYSGGNEINIAMERGEVQGAQQFLVKLEGHQAGVAQGEEAVRHRAGRRQGEGPRRARDRRPGQNRSRPSARRSHHVGRGARPSDDDDAGRSGSAAACACAQPSWR